MPWGLKRYYGDGSLHFITWSCYRRLPLLAEAPARDLLLSVIELMRKRYRFAVIGYVVMPEHVHLLVSEPPGAPFLAFFAREWAANPSTVVQAVKLGFCRSWAAKTGFSGQFWQRRFYDFNLWSQRKETEKLKYMHRNPVVRGLVADPADWPWSSYRSYAYGEAGLVRINDWKWWEEKIRERAG
jgi:putative transposase